MLIFSILGIFGGLGHFCFILALRKSEASFLAPFTYFDLIFASILGTPLFSNYESKTIFNSLRDLYPEKIAYVESNNWGVRVENKMNQNIEFCWINILCIPPIDYDLKEINFNGYRLISAE